MCHTSAQSMGVWVRNDAFSSGITKTGWSYKGEVCHDKFLCAIF